jgi:hypothetical protein
MEVSEDRVSETGERSEPRPEGRGVERSRARDAQSESVERRYKERAV